MASLKQVEANRRNALNSTGPKSEAGKQRSRGNAARHGLTAAKIIEVLEDPEDCEAFEASVTTNFDAQSVVERELILRQASLFWRLRLATTIETGLLPIQVKDPAGGEASAAVLFAAGGTQPRRHDAMLRIEPGSSMLRCTE
jgi:hypothetical protein